MIHKVASSSRILGVKIRSLRKKLPPDLHSILDSVNTYLTDYCNYYHMTPDDIIRCLDKFNQRYVSDIESFMDTGKYPLENGNVEFNLTRTEYDIFLIASILFTEHRFNIIKNLFALRNKFRKSACIGSGAGIELPYIIPNTITLAAYDLSISEYLKIKYPYM